MHFFSTTYCSVNLNNAIGMFESTIFERGNLDFEINSDSNFYETSEYLDGIIMSTAVNNLIKDGYSFFHYLIGGNHTIFRPTIGTLCNILRLLDDEQVRLISHLYDTLEHNQEIFYRIQDRNLLITDSLKLRLVLEINQDQILETGNLGRSDLINHYTNHLQHQVEKETLLEVQNMYRMPQFLSPEVRTLLNNNSIQIYNGVRK